ncbi:MAG: RRXRR domain-containing protein [Nitrospirae bacterium]|nr:RRXRR domain-containing protein [Nitrospirota bacterium]MCL5422108.1 RRXRR domain-containing protein [Nitrospirota bacterium]
MEKELVLGIDYGGKYTGLAVVDQRNNQVLYARTLKMRDDVADILKGRREQRGIRRTGQTKKKRLRELKAYLKSIGGEYDESIGTFKNEPFMTVYKLCHKRGYDYAEMPEEKTHDEIEAMSADEKKQWEKEKKEREETQRNSRHRDEVTKDVRKVMSERGATELQISHGIKIFNRQYRPKRFNNRILTKCKVEDCGVNTPLRKNVRDLLIKNIVRFLPLTQPEKAELEAYALDKEGREKVKTFFRRHRINEFLRKQIYDIAFNQNLTGRTVFCKKHILEHEQHTKEERKVFRLAPSLKTKINNVLAVVKNEILPQFGINKVIMESNNFDIAARTKGKKRLAKDEYGKGHKEAKESLIEVLLRETKNQCVYCGKVITVTTANTDHIFPRKAGGINVFANLVACCRECNEKKKGRTPLESGVLPQPEITAHIENDLKKKILEDARNINDLNLNSIKYMSHASIGWRHMRDRLRELTGNEELPIERQSGILTAYFRRWWGFRKERGNDIHHALDAVILASRKDYIDDGIDMTLKPKFSDGREFDPEKHLPDTISFKRDKSNKGTPLYDKNPLSIKNSLITRRWIVTEIEHGKEDTIISDDYRKKLKEAFKHFGTSKGKCLNDEEARQAGFYQKKNGNFMSLRCREKGLGWGQMVKINNNAFKTNVHNIGVAVCLDQKGKKKAYEIKNPRLLKHFLEQPPEIEGKKLYTLKRGDYVTHEGEDSVYRIKKLGTSPVLEAVVKGSIGRIRNSASATKLTKVSKPQQVF